VEAIKQVLLKYACSLITTTSIYSITPSCDSLIHSFLQTKRELYIASRNCYNPLIKKPYKSYCKIVSSGIKEVKILCYDNEMMNSTDKIKTLWKIINLETCRRASNAAIEFLNAYGMIINNQQVVAATFNNCFLSVP